MEIHNSKDLELAIIELEKRKASQNAALKEQFERAKSSIMPVNLIKSSISSITHTPEIRNSAIKTAAGIGVGLLTKNMFLGKATPLIKSLVENAIERGVQDGVADSVLAVKSYSKAIWHNLFKNKKSKSKKTI